jgi:hypothetical protein
VKLLKQHQELRQQIFKYFNYIEDWGVFPLMDYTNYYWNLNDGVVGFSEHETDLFETEDDECDRYEVEVYTYCHLNKWVYHGNEYTMILVDTKTDGNIFLAVFDNTKKRETDEHE